MIVRQVDIWHLKLPFHYPFKHTLATHASSENLVVKITTENGSAGYGEGVPRVFVTGESLTGSISFLSETLGPAVFGASFSAPGNLVQESLAIWRSAGADRFPAALCALEMALWDAAGLTWGIPLSDFLGGKVRENVSYSAVLPLASEKQLLRLLELIKAMRMRFVKLKVGEANDLKVLEMIRKELGGEIDVRVDANGAWTAEEAVARLRDMLPYRISAVEQPVAKEDFAGLQRVSESLEIPVAKSQRVSGNPRYRR
jgi:muconate cycloisomerase